MGKVQIPVKVKIDTSSKSFRKVGKIVKSKRDSEKECIPGFVTDSPVWIKNKVPDVVKLSV